MESSQLDLLRTDEMDIALRLNYLEHCEGPPSGSPADDKEARRKEKKKQKDLKVPAHACSIADVCIAQCSYVACLATYTGVACRLCTALNVVDYFICCTLHIDAHYICAVGPVPCHDAAWN